MRHAWAILGLGLLMVGGQGGSRSLVAQTPTFESQQNRFNPATTIPFKVSGELFLKGHRPVVSLRIYNVLAQLVAIPILRGTDKPLDSLALTCPTTLGCRYNAYWDGYVAGKPAASGVYIYQLVIDGRRVTKKIVVK
ncbi:MAG TPA: T9SS type A sorting domain-containing protein [Gemmatimonadales bacterium]|nr:T9SS type A sorting domain-containing protein [Gemmatimonadales bacterium]